MRPVDQPSANLPKFAENASIRAFRLQSFRPRKSTIFATSVRDPNERSRSTQALPRHPWASHGPDTSRRASRTAQNRANPEQSVEAGTSKITSFVRRYLADKRAAEAHAARVLCGAGSLVCVQAIVAGRPRVAGLRARKSKFWVRKRSLSPSRRNRYKYSLTRTPHYALHVPGVRAYLGVL